MQTAHVGQALNQRMSGENTILADSEDGISCPHWLFPIHTENGSIACECGDSVAGAVLCNNKTQKVEVHKYYCMTYSSDNPSLVVGKCLYGRKYYHYHKHEPFDYYHLPSNVSKVCDLFYREGQLCGKCIDGFAPPVYSYDPSCVNCTEYSSNWVKYIAISFLPPTALFVVVVTFRISATSGLLNVFVLACQIVSAPLVVKTIVQHTPNLKLTSHIGLSLSSLNLLVEMHDHNVRIVVWLWKPFHAYFVHFLREVSHTSFAFLILVHVYSN